jgi:plastocyanin
MPSKNDDNNKTVLATLALMLLSLSVASSIAINAPHYANAQGVTGQGGGNATNATMAGGGNATNGTTVTWTNNDSQPHTVTSGSNGQPDNKFNSSPNFTPLLNPGQTFSFTFTEAGEYPYYCMLHPNMVGTVSVS